ncbi:hypothetical protein NP493_653g01007 [Ridgeia piscesae]|uniref:Uncharacterized protein n=1 Tax=Ridgeia piscesae TaxID=27915 RepID=A0AAD9NNJ0_RIDPI|nr:hypothetical protein NP493_653g01007 [Ridgeia piscesae]
MFVNNNATSAYEMRRQREALLDLIVRLLEINDNKPYLQTAFERAKMLRVTKQQQQAARAQHETALRDVARRAATAVAEDVATTIVNKTSTTKCSEEAIASSVNESLSLWRDKNPMGKILGDENIRDIAKTEARQALNQANTVDIIAATLTKHLRIVTNSILLSGEHYKKPADQLSSMISGTLPPDIRKMLSDNRLALLAEFTKQLVDDKRAHDTQLQVQAKLSRLISHEARVFVKRTPYRNLKKIGINERLRAKLLDEIARRVKARGGRSGA